MESNINLIYINNNNPQICIQISNILMIQAEGHYVKIFTKSEKFIGGIFPRATLSELENLLPKYFLRISRFQIINTQEIEHILENEILFKCGKNYPLKAKSTFKKLKHLRGVLYFA